MIVGNVQHCCSSSLAAHTGPRLRPLLLLFLPFSGVRICRLYINQKWKVYACNCENAKIPLFSSFACLLDDARARAFCAPFVRYSEQQTFNGKMDMLQQQHNFTLEIKMAPNQVAMQLCKLFVRLCFFLLDAAHTYQLWTWIMTIFICIVMRARSFIFFFHSDWIHKVA